jgi:hypothetical protein
VGNYDILQKTNMMIFLKLNFDIFQKK